MSLLRKILCGCCACSVGLYSSVKEDGSPVAGKSESAGNIMRVAVLRTAVRKLGLEKPDLDNVEEIAVDEENMLREIP